MKFLSPTLFAVTVLLSGCLSTESILKTLPNGSADEFTYIRGGKFSAGTFKFLDYKKDESRVSATLFNAHHSNVWIPNVEISAKNFVLGLKPVNASLDTKIPPR